MSIRSWLVIRTLAQDCSRGGYQMVQLHYSDCSNLTKTQHRDSERGCRMGYHEVVGQAHESHFALALKHRTVLSDPVPSLSD